MVAAQDRQHISTRATGIVGVAILCSRVLGLIREVVFAALFGATRNMDAFLTAFRAPNMLRDLFRRRRALDRVCYDVLAPHRHRRRRVGLATREQSRNADGRFHERRVAPRRPLRAPPH